MNDFFPKAVALILVYTPTCFSNGCLPQNDDFEGLGLAHTIPSNRGSLALEPAHVGAAIVIRRRVGSGHLGRHGNRPGNVLRERVHVQARLCDEHTVPASAAGKQ